MGSNPREEFEGEKQKQSKQIRKNEKREEKERQKVQGDHTKARNEKLESLKSPWTNCNREKLSMNLNKAKIAHLL
jgi:hypothetical protein